MIYKNSERMRDFLGLFNFIVVLVFYMLGAFLLQQLFHSCLSIISYPMRVHGIIVEYFVLALDVSFWLLNSSPPQGFQFDNHQDQW